MIEGLQPYPDYQRSRLPWVPEIPSHWELVPNRALLKRRKVLVGKEHNRFQLLSLTKGGVIVRDISTGKGKFSADMGSSQEVRPGDFIFCLFDVPETPRTVGLSKHQGMITSAYTLFEPRNLSSVGARYLEQFYIAMDDRKLLSPLYSGLRHTIPPTRFLGTKTPQPPADEQQAIVRFMAYTSGKIERFIRSKRKLIGLLNERRQAIIHRAVTRGLHADAPLKPSGAPWLGDVPRHWGVIPLGRLCTSRCDGPFGSGLKSAHYVDSGVRVIRLQNIGNGEFLNRSAAFIDPKHYATLGDHSVVAGDLLVAGLGDDRIPAGRACVAPDDIEPAMVKADCFRFRLRQERAEAQFLALHLSATATVATACLSTGATRLRINLSATASRAVALPPLSEQRQIVAAVLEEAAPLNTALARTEREIALMQEYRARLVAEVVTGKLDVRVAVAKLPEMTPEDLSTGETEAEDEEYNMDEPPNA